MRTPAYARDALATVVRRLRVARASPEAVWRRGTAHEVGWWRDWVAEQGRRWPEEFEERLDPSAPLREELIVELLPAIPRDPVRILDVGAGPATSLGKTHPGRTLEIVAVDPLAREYERLWREAGRRPPVPTEPCSGERLVERFGRGRFDVAYARNALDHTIDPLAVVEQMVEVVADDGYVVLRHAQNEGEKAGYRGLHQWNLGVEGGDLVVRRPGRTTNVSAALAGRAEVACRVEGETLTCVLRKARPMSGVRTADVEGAQDP